MNHIKKAGVIILRSASPEPEALLVFRGKQNDWTFPKGHCEEGESFEQTAIREVREETGLEIDLLQTLPDMLYTDGKGEEVVLQMYLGRPRTDSPKERPEKPEDRVEWVPLSKVEGRLSYQNLKDYFSSVKERLV